MYETWLKVGYGRCAGQVQHQSVPFDHSASITIQCRAIHAASMKMGICTFSIVNRNSLAFFLVMVRLASVGVGSVGSCLYDTVELSPSPVLITIPPVNVEVSPASFFCTTTFASRARFHARAQVTLQLLEE